MICPEFEQIYNYLFLTVSNYAWISTIHINVSQVEAIAHMGYSFLQENPGNPVHQRNPVS
jgi:hypothetical protein